MKRIKFLTIYVVFSIFIVLLFTTVSVYSIGAEDLNATIGIYTMNELGTGRANPDMSYQYLDVQGDPAVIKAPYIEGLSIQGDLQLYEPELKNSNVYLFNYKMPEGNTTLYLVDSNTQEIINEVYMNNPTSQLVTVNAVDLSAYGYTSTTMSQSITINPNNPESSKIYFYYDKNLIDYTVNCYDSNTGNIISTEVIQVPSHDIALIYAPDVAGYTLESNYYDKSYAISDKTVNFNYSVKTTNDVTIRYIDENDYLLSTFTINDINIGQEYSYTAPNIIKANGKTYEIADNQQKSLTVSSDENILTYVYNEERPEDKNREFKIYYLDNINSYVFHSESVVGDVGETFSYTPPSKITIYNKTYTVVDNMEYTATINKDQNLNNLYITYTLDELNVKIDTNHKAYIMGYSDNTIRPDDEITRAELGAMIYRLIYDRNKGTAEVSSPFTDVSDNAWYSHYISYLYDKKVITGYSNNKYEPNKKITRAEMASILSRFLLICDDENPFTDMQYHWASKYVDFVYSNNIMQGYDNGQFRPDREITRAEAVKTLNRLANRYTKTEDIPTATYYLYTDLQVPADHWSFNEIYEASFDHVYERYNDMSEKWTSYTTFN